MDCCGGRFWLYVAVIVSLVCFAGMMAGLTLGLMSLSLVDLEVLIKSGRPLDRIHASKIFPVVKNQHLLLCTLLIGNSLAMESLPIFLDKLVPPWAAILVSVTLILAFGEILPQAICTRYGMRVGAMMAPFVHILLMVFFPVAYPISKMLDWMLGKGHAVLLRRPELKTFMNFHGNEAGKGGDLTRDETTIIAGALELTEKTVKDAMTPISKAFSLDLNGILDVQMLNMIMTKGHSRVPIYSGNPSNIIGIILVKNLLTVDPKDSIPLRKMTIRKIPRVSENMPLYDILNEFQKGHSHMAVVVKDHNEKQHLVENKSRTEHVVRTKKKRGSVSSSNEAVKGEGGRQPVNQPFSPPVLKKRHRGCTDCVLDINHAPIPDYPNNEEVVGVITMEDVIEEILQEEILDETDEYVNIHNRIKVNMQASQNNAKSLSPSSSALTNGTLSELSQTSSPMF
ncbi:DUF21 domain-containing protein [Acorus calamus]|uniref:DUF21 domain-containing protein n=1 Tax=Acorus calamus TaxID=4465 RepID=A0AAV9FDP4_ACOCL|nr:DUF21 domain-containing protein [Acorus calamus]